MKRWLVAGVALMISGAVSAGLLVAANPSRDTVEVVAAARDVQAGAQLGPDAMALVRVNLGATRSLFFTRNDQPVLAGLRATHDLVSGQLIQRSDVTSAQSPPDHRLVFVPVKDVPPLAPGSQVDLLVITGQPDRTAVQLFASGVEVRSSTPAGLVLVVPADRAAAFVYAGAVMQLVAVVADAGSTQGTEVPVSGDQQAMDMAGRT